jgi:hypothetical protein
VTRFHDDPDNVKECNEKTTREGSAPWRSAFENVRDIVVGREGDDVFLLGDGVRERPFVTVGFTVRDGVSDLIVRVGVVEFVGVGVRMCVCVGEGVFVGVLVGVSVGFSRSDSEGVGSSEGLAEFVMIAGGVNTRETDPDNSAVAVSVSVSHDVFVLDGVLLVAVSFNDRVTPLPVFVLVTEAADDMDCE